jgi:carbonic anhydrase
VGNIVPPAHVTGSTNSTAAAIEFAVEVLQVGDIVVCGHSQCGAMEALLRAEPPVQTMPNLNEWLRTAQPVRRVIETGYQHLKESQERITAAAEENVLFALENLHSYPAVQRRLAEGSLRLHGWFFKIATAELFAYDPEAMQFLPLSSG